MIEMILISALIIFGAVIGTYLVTLRKVSIEMRKQIVELEFAKINNR